jgi:SAM-dependent methyltransferase
MLSRNDIVEIFTEILGRSPRSESWITQAACRHQSRDTLVSELRSSAEFREKSRKIPLHGTFLKLFTESGASSDVDAGCSDQLPKLGEKLKIMQQIQGDYHPVYGLGSEHEKSPRLHNLLFDCEQVEQHFSSVKNKNQVRILDIGCNLGYVSFKLAAKGFKVIGLDINASNIDICRTIAACTGSQARFEALDLLKLAEDPALDWDNLDCVLMLNVVHQFVFTRGLPYVTTFLRRLATRVDVLFVELARKQDYVSHGKDHLLPKDPAAVFAECENIDICILKEQGRPLYKLTRQSAAFGPVAIRPQRIAFTDNENSSISRKYYQEDGRFLKAFRFTPQARAWFFRAGVPRPLGDEGKRLGSRDHRLDDYTLLRCGSDGEGQRSATH